MLVIYNRVADHVPLKVVNIEDGATLRQFNHPLHRTRKIDFIEQFNEKLLVKQEGEPLQIIDVHTHSLVSVATTDFLTPAAFIFLYDKQLFLTFRNRYVHVWNFRGEMVTAFDDHTLWHPDTNTNNIYITSTQDYIVSYCRRSDTDWAPARRPHLVDPHRRVSRGSPTARRSPSAGRDVALLQRGEARALHRQQAGHTHRLGAVRRRVRDTACMRDP